MSLSSTMWTGPRPYLHTMWHLDPFSRLATIGMGRKLGGGSASFLGMGAGSPSNTKSPGLRPTSIPSLDASSRTAFGHNRTGPKIGGLHPLCGEGAGSPSNTETPGLTPTFVPSGIFVYPAVWPQYLWTEKWRNCCTPFWEGELGPHLIQCRLGPDLAPYQVTF